MWHQRQNHRCDSDTDTTFCHNVIVSSIKAYAGRKVTLSHTDRYNPLALAVVLAPVLPKGLTDIT